MSPQTTTSLLPATDPLSLLHSLPDDDAKFKALCERLESLEDLVSPHLDAFSSTAPENPPELDRDALVSLFRAHRRNLEIAILVLSTRLRAVPVRSIYAGHLLATLCEDALRQRKSKDLALLLQRLEARDPEGWERVVNSCAAMAANGWREWPSVEDAREAIAALELLDSSWTAVVEQRKRELSGSINRERRRDPAYRRAINWKPLLLGLLRRLTSPGGPLRIVIDYCFTVTAYFESAIVKPSLNNSNRAACDLLILEVFGMLEQYSLTEDELETDAPRFLEQGETNRRKRIQRARLQVMLNWQLLVDDVAWLEWVHPALDRIVHGPDQLGGPDESAGEPSPASPPPTRETEPSPEPPSSRIEQAPEPSSSRLEQAPEPPSSHSDLPFSY